MTNMNASSWGRRIVALWAIILVGLVPNVTWAGNSFVTDGEDLLSQYSYFTADTAWRVDASDYDDLSVTPLDASLLGPDDGALVDSSGWTTIYDGDNDDSFAAVDIGFDIPFNGDYYNRAFLSSNTYLSFGRGSDTYSDFSPTYPAVPGLHFCSGDNSYQRVYTTGGEGYTVVRYEGTDSTSGVGGDPNIIYEVVFYYGEPYFDVLIGMNAACTEGDTLPPTITGIPATGETLYGEKGTWHEADGPFTFSYQWQRNIGGEDPDWIDIPGATDLEYLITDDDIGYGLRLAVTADNGIDTYTQVSDSANGLIMDTVEISTCAELMAIDGLNNPYGAYALVNDIDCAEEEVHALTWTDGEALINFGGYFNGRGYTISNFTLMAGGDYSGLFSHIEDDDAVIQDLILENISIDGGDTSGAVVGEMNGGTLKDITVINGDVYSYGGYVGGIVGNIWADERENGSDVNVKNVSFQGYVSSGEGGGLYTGGFAGNIEANRIEMSIDQVSIDAVISGTGDYVGGFAGYAYAEDGTLTITRSSVQGTINAMAGGYIGGFFGAAETFSFIYDSLPWIRLYNTFANLTINGGYIVGGLIGQTTTEHAEGARTSIEIENSYVAGDIMSGEGGIGGLISSIGSIVGEDSVLLKNSFVAALFNSYGYGILDNYNAMENAPTLQNVHFDSWLADTNWCDASNDFECYLQNEFGEAGGYFYSALNEPMASWNFDRIWVEQGEGYPIFNTAAEVAPTVSTLEATGGITSRRAIVYGEITDTGSSSVTARGFEYGLTEAYGQTVAEDGEGFGTGEYNLQIDDLRCGRIYHYRAYATNGAGTDYGNDFTFRTKACDNTFIPSSPDDKAGSAPPIVVPGPTPTPEPTPEPAPERTPMEPVYNPDTDRYTAPESGEVGRSPYQGTVEPISAVQAGWYIRGENYDTVYYVDENLVRHPFWDSTTYFTWEDSWDKVIWVTDATLGKLMVGSPMIPKPGVVLVKLMSRSEVYAVDEESGGQPTLHHVASEDLARQYFGERWQDYVIDVPPTIFPHYAMGAALGRSGAWSAEGMKTRAELQH